jgi:hypothetical protein
VEKKLIRETGANNPAIGYNLTPLRRRRQTEVARRVAHRPARLDGSTPCWRIDPPAVAGRRSPASEPVGSALAIAP